MAHNAVIIMGVQGTGKSTIGELLARAENMAFIDGDDLHPVANKQKMASGRPLNDADREPWLRTIGATIAENLQENQPTVVVCSALKRKYRDALRDAVPGLFFVHLHGSKDLIAQRIATRDHEYMPASLLDSQFATLEHLQPDENGVMVNIDQSVKDMVYEAQQALRAGAA